MEMGKYCYEFHSRLTQDTKGLHGNLGNCRPTDKVGTLPSGKATYTVDNWAQLYVKEIVRLHVVPASIVSDRDPRFISAIWHEFQKVLGTRLDFSTAFHPQTNGQTERLNQILEDMLRACVMDFTGCWDTKLDEIPIQQQFPSNNRDGTV